MAGVGVAAVPGGDQDAVGSVAHSAHVRDIVLVIDQHEAHRGGHVGQQLAVLEAPLRHADNALVARAHNAIRVAIVGQRPSAGSVLLARLTRRRDLF